jgi:RNA polymerase primary sigma factor
MDRDMELSAAAEVATEVVTEVMTIGPALEAGPDLLATGARTGAARKAPPRLRKNAPVIPPKRGTNGRPAAPAAAKPAAKTKARKAPALDEIAALEDPEQAPEELTDAEAVEPAEPAEGDEEVVSVAAVADQDFLGTYFKDLTRLPLLTPAAEYELARRIGIMEEVLWVQALSLAPLVPHLFGVITTHVGQPLPEFGAVEKEATELWQGGKATGKQLSHVAAPLAARLRQLDQDRLFISGLLEELRRIDSAVKNGQPNPVSELSVPKETWQIFLQGTSVVNQLIQRAKEDFVKANLRLVVSIARRFNYGRLPLADLIQEGNMGLIKAVERFDYRRGFRFSTYASWWIRHAIARGLADKGRVVRLPVHALAELQSVTRERAKLQRALGRQPTTEELAAALKVRPDRLEKMEGALLDDAVSLDREVSGDDKRAFLDLLKDETAVLSISERLISEAMLAEVQKILAALSPIEKDILRLRFGLDSDQELTLSEIGEKYSLSRKRIRQIQEQALNRMRRALVRKDLI